MSVRFVIDTNIYLNNLNTLLTLCKQGKDAKILLPRIILHELDMLKITELNARKAVKFIMENTDNIIIEGTDEKMDIECEVDTVIKNLEKGNNDDKILKFVHENYNSILVTKDQSLILKAMSFNIKYMKFNQFVEFMHNKNDALGNLNENMQVEADIKNLGSNAIERFIEKIAHQYNLSYYKMESASFIEKLEFMLRHFHYYTSAVSNNSKEEITKIKNELSNNINTHYNITRLKIICGVAYK